MSDVPEGIQNAFNTCSGGLCVPDQVLKAGIFSPPSCKTTVVGLNLVGACLSQCWLQVMNNSMVSLLNAGDCTGAGELCAPCTDPLEKNAPTGACTIPALECPAADGGAGDAGGGDAGSACPYTGPPLVDAGSFAECSPACGGAHCVPTTLVPAAEQSELLSCTATGGVPGLCAPDTIIESGGNGLPPTCTSIVGAEGRCLSTCIPQVADLALVLPQDVCPAGTLCAPCFNPTASDPTASTGACNTACDSPKDPPTILPCPYPDAGFVDTTQFPACSPACAGAHCLPSALVPTGLQSQLATCTGGFCVPDVQAAVAGDYLPPTCVSVAGSEGRCLSTCLPEVASEAEILPQSICAANERCVPCYDPAAADPTAPTGACSSVPCDSPKEPPVILTCPWNVGDGGVDDVVNPAQLPPCDGANGCAGAHCFPAAFVPSALQSQLSPCGTGSTAGFCTPDLFIATGNEVIPTSCDPFGTAANPSGAEGRCLSNCLPMIADEADAGLVVQSTCAANEVCAPCNDPFTGASTGACTLGCDMAPKKPFTFPTCCDDGTGKITGTCVPTELIPTAEQSEVDESGNNNTVQCPSSLYSCVPDTYLPAPYNAAYPLQKCTSTSLLTATYGTCGTCVSECVSQTEFTTVEDLLNQDGCPTFSKCLPCEAADTTPGCPAFCP